MLQMVTILTPGFFLLLCRLQAVSIQRGSCLYQDVGHEMRILITGGAGFIGSNLAAYHLEKGDEVHAIEDLSTGSIENVIPSSSTVSSPSAM